MWSSAKERLFQNIGIPDKDFKKIKFSYFKDGFVKVHELEDGDVLSDLDCKGSIGLDHADKGIKKFAGEKSIKIFN